MSGQAASSSNGEQTRQRGRLRLAKLEALVAQVDRVVPVHANHVGFAALEHGDARGLLGGIEQHQVVERGFVEGGAPVVFIGRELGADTRRELGELPRAGADGLLRKRVESDLLEILLGMNPRAGDRVRVEQVRRGLGMHDRRVRVGHLDGADRLAVHRRPGACRGIGVVAIDAELDVLGREIVAIGEFHALADVEGPRQAVGAHFPAFGKPGDEVALVVVLQQRFIDQRHDVEVRSGEDRVQVLGREVGQGDIQCAGGSARGLCGGRGWRGGGSGGRLGRRRSSCSSGRTGRLAGGRWRAGWRRSRRAGRRGRRG